jgi:hypothetical protein
MKLPASKFDEIYEACKDGGVYEGHAFTWHIEGADEAMWTILRRKFVEGNGGDYDAWVEFCLEAYRTGEIRDKGAMEEKAAHCGWGDEEPKITPYGKSRVDTPQQPWYKLDHKVFDPLVDNPNEFRLTAHNNFKKVWDLFGGRGISLEKVADMMVNQYKLGILRDAGPLVETPNYDHAFSVKDGRMVVDWDALEVTKENALEISIASWKWLYEWLNESEGTPKRNASACALCQLYNLQSGCRKCPIKKLTGTDYCGGTPYENYIDATTLHEALDACRDEIAFLEGLR